MSAALVAAREREYLTHHSSPSIERLMRLYPGSIEARLNAIVSRYSSMRHDRARTSSVNTAFAARVYSDVLASSRNPGPRRRHPDRLRGPLPKTQTCLDGSVIDTTATCPPPPPPVPIELGERGQWADRTNGRAAPLWVGQTQGSAKLLTGTARAPREGGSSCQISQMPVCATAASPG